MRRLLLITYAYPPALSAGMIRPAALAKHLPQFGWEVLVMTPKQKAPGTRPMARVIETDYEDVLERWKRRVRLSPRPELREAKVLTATSSARHSALRSWASDLARHIIAFPDRRYGWIPYATDALHRLRQEERVDAVLSTSPPPTCHLIAAKARRILGCSWIADFRDLWAEQNFFDARRYLRPFHISLEKRTLKSADALVTVSRPWAGRLRQAYPDKPVHVITNGFDPEDFPKAPPLTSFFSITHAGFLYEGRRDPTLLFEVLHDLISEGAIRKSDFRVRFYGQLETWLPQLARRYGVDDVVDIGGRIPRQEALQREMESQLLLLLGWSDPREVGQHTGKLFEYFGAARPILAIGGAEGVLTETLRETNAGVHARSKEQVRRALLAAYREFKQTGAVAYRPYAADISQYTHSRMAKNFADTLNATVAAKARFNSEPSATVQEDTAALHK